jgi:hypothetical protein
MRKFALLFSQQFTPEQTDDITYNLKVDKS